MKTYNIIKVFSRKSLQEMCFLMCITSLIFQSCAELDPDLTEFNNPPGEFVDLEQMNRGVTGIYNQVNSAASMTTFYAPAWAGDDMTTHRALNKADFREFDQRAVLSSNNRLLRNWNNTFDAVIGINDLFESSISLLDQDDIDQEILVRQLGEAYFLRGILFYQLQNSQHQILKDLL